MKIIEVVISPRGEVTIQTRGFAGAECLQASQAIEKALGAKLTYEATPEYYTTSAQQNEVKA